MNGMNMLIWLSQLGLSVAAPLTCCMVIALWLRQRYALGIWVVLLGLGLGAVCAVQGFRQTLAAMERMARREQQNRSVSPSENERE